VPNFSVVLGMLLFSLASFGGQKKFHRIDGNWKVAQKKDEVVFASGFAHSQITHLRSPASQITFVAKPAVPTSIRSVANRISESSGDPKSLKVLKKKGHPTSFAFTAKDQIHWYSVKGGHLVATTSGLTKKIYEDLIERVEVNP